MPASPHDLQLSAFLVPFTDEIEHLAAALRDLCTALGTGHADHEQRRDVDRRSAEAIEHLALLRTQLTPGAPLQLDVTDQPTEQRR